MATNKKKSVKVRDLKPSKDAKGGGGGGKSSSHNLSAGGFRSGSAGTTSHTGTGKVN